VLYPCKFNCIWHTFWMNIEAVYFRVVDFPPFLYTRVVDLLYYCTMCKGLTPVHLCNYGLWAAVYRLFGSTWDPAKDSFWCLGLRSVGVCCPDCYRPLLASVSPSLSQSTTLACPMRPIRGRVDRERSWGGTRLSQWMQLWIVVKFKSKNITYFNTIFKIGWIFF